MGAGYYARQPAGNPGCRAILAIRHRWGGLCSLCSSGASLKHELLFSKPHCSQDYDGKPVADVAWAPTLGRPYDIVAVAAGPTVLLWRLTGAADSLQVGCVVEGAVSGVGKGLGGHDM